MFAAKPKRISLNWKELLVHYCLSILFFMPLITAVIDLRRFPSRVNDLEGLDFILICAMVGLLYLYLQYRRLHYREFLIPHSEKDFHHALGKTISELKWRTQRSRDGYYRGNRVGIGYGFEYLGEMITIVSDNNSILINSISDPNQAPNLTTFGWNRRNIRAFIRNLKSIIAERKASDQPAATGLHMSVRPDS